MDNQSVAPSPRQPPAPTQPQAPRQFMDVTRPGNTAASASGKPVIVGNKTLQNDPMMTPPAPAPQPVAPAIQVVPPLSTSPVAQTVPPKPAQQPAEAPAQGEPLHKLQHENAFFGHVGSHKKNKVWLIIFVFVVIALAAGGYLLLPR